MNALLDAWAVIAVAATAWLLGRAAELLLGRFRGVVGRWLAGFVLLHLVLQLADLLALRWSGLGLLALALAAAAIPLWRRLPPLPRPQRLDLAGVAALLVLVAVLWAAVTLRAPLSDFVYHWGMKGQRFALAQGVDWSFLARPENGIYHPDYPQLLPELLALTGILLGSFREPALMLWSVLFLALLFVAVREALHVAQLPLAAQRWGTAALAAGISAFAIGYSVLGGPDPLIALALLAGGTRIARAGDDEDPTGGARLGFTAAFAAASKIEGIPLAFLLLVLWWWARRQRLRRKPLAELLAPALPVVAVVGLWAGRVAQYGLLQESNVESFEPVRLLVVLGTALRLLWIPAWYGLAGVVLLIPLLLLVRRSRPWALVAAGQLGLYFFIYLSSPHDPEWYVISNFPRLLLHVVPALLVAALAAASAWIDRPAAASAAEDRP